MKLTSDIDYVYADDGHGGIVQIDLDWEQDVTWERGELNDCFDSIQEYFESKTGDWYISLEDCIRGKNPFTEFEA